jgi:hypothetical protein
VVFLNLLAKEVRHFDSPITLECFRLGNDILTIDPLKRFVDRDGASAKVEIRWCKGEQLA